MWTLQHTVKRLLDIAISLIAGVFLFPLGLFIALAIRITSGSPVFYRWPVVGQNGLPLRAYKFRTMVPGAENLKHQLEARNESTGPVFKLRNDPRITPLGRYLRKFSLDELPQLWSVFNGDMSLVGPRPVLISEWERFSAFHRQKLAVKPGAVSLWHVSGQPRDFDSWIQLDLEYIEHWSLGLDLRILWSALFYLALGKNY